MYRGGAAQWTDQEFWGQADLDFNSSLGIFLFQDLEQIRLPLCFILGFLICEMGIKEPNFTAEETKCVL